MLELADLLEKNNFITHIDFSRNNIADDIGKLIKCTQLKSINLDQNDVGDEGIVALLKFPQLEELELCCNFMTNKGAQLLLGKCGPSFRARIFDNRNIDESLVAAIAEKGQQFHDAQEAKHKTASTTGFWCQEQPIVSPTGPTAGTVKIR